MNAEMEILKSRERALERELVRLKKTRIRRQGHREDDLQTACVRWFGLQFPKYEPLLHHSPNGGARNIITGARFKRMGTRAGFPDLILCVARRGFHGLFIEMKTESSQSRQSEAQKAMQGLLEGQGYRYFVCRTFDDFRKVVLWYLAPKT